MEKTQYYPEIKRYVKSKIEHSEDAKDLTQQVFLEYFKAKDREKNIQSSKAYLYGTAKIKIADYYREKKKPPKLVQFKTIEKDKICGTKHINDSDTKEISEELKKAISLLPPKAKEAIELILFNNLSYEQAAKKANCSFRIFYERFYKGRKIIKSFFDL